MLQIQELWQEPNVVSLTSIRDQSALGPAPWNQKGFPASKAFNTLFDDSLLCHWTRSAGLYYYYIRLYYIRLHYIIYIIYIIVYYIVIKVSKVSNTCTWYKERLLCIKILSV